MNRLIWKLLRRHVSIGQLTGFFLANLFGMAIVLLAVQAYADLRPVLSGGDSFLKQDYLIAGKKTGTLGSLMGKNSTFTPEEIEDLRQQPFTVQVGCFTPSLFHVSAGMGIQGTGVDLSTEMFFEAVPDEFIDADLSQWHYDEATRTIPIIIPRNYLNLYNFGFAESRGLPKLSEGLTGLLRMDITLRGNGHVEHYKGRIVGFSNRLNTILVPQAFMEQANQALAPGQQAQPSRLILEVNNPADEAIARYFQQKNYETEGDALDDGKAAWFLRLLTGVVLAVGLVISLLSFYLLLLSIFLLLQKNAVKLENLLLIGHSPAQVALPYHLLATGLNVASLVAAIGCVSGLRAAYMDGLRRLFPALESGGTWPCLLTGGMLLLLTVMLNTSIIRRKILAISRLKEKEGK